MTAQVVIIAAVVHVDTKEAFTIDGIGPILPSAMPWRGLGERGLSHV